jgi:hypothetical protein
MRAISCGVRIPPTRRSAPLGLRTLWLFLKASKVGKFLEIYCHGSYADDTDAPPLSLVESRTLALRLFLISISRDLPIEKQGRAVNMEGLREEHRYLADFKCDAANGQSQPPGTGKHASEANR